MSCWIVRSPGFFIARWPVVLDQFFRTDLNVVRRFRPDPDLVVIDAQHRDRDPFTGRQLGNEGFTGAASEHEHGGVLASRAIKINGK